jgi:hypothetical protein
LDERNLAAARVQARSPGWETFMRALALTTVMLSLVATTAWCDGPVSTAPGPGSAQGSIQGSGQPGARNAPVAQLDPADQDSDDTVVMGACGPTRSVDGAPDTAVHGQVDVGVSNRGHYVGAAACKPLSNGGSVSVSVGQSQQTWRGR